MIQLKHQESSNDSNKVVGKIKDEIKENEINDMNVKNNKWKKLIKTFKNNEEIK